MEARPHALLICCEGKTEKEYFQILQRVYRPIGVSIMIVGEKGQHISLVDRTLEERLQISTMFDIKEESIESWAVCDNDRMSITFAELERYAEERRVHVAFSQPQFECYLLQHFEPSRSIRRTDLYEQLTKYAMEYGGRPYGNDTKSDLHWLSQAIMDKPKFIDIAITNASQRTTPSKSPFSTVQRLTTRLKELGR